MGSQLFIKSVTINMSANVEKSAKPKKAKTTTKKVDAAAHPPSSVMVVKAIEDLKERKGSSLAAIKKYIGANYKVDLAKVSVFIRKALKSGIEKKTLVASAGMGGRFKIAKTESKPKPKKIAKKATPSKKKATPKKAEKTKSSAKTKTAKPKKPVAKKPTKKPATKKAAPKKK